MGAASGNGVPERVMSALWPAMQHFGNSQAVLLPNLSTKERIPNKDVLYYDQRLFTLPELRTEIAGLNDGNSTLASCWRVPTLHEMIADAKNPNGILPTVVKSTDGGDSAFFWTASACLFVISNWQACENKPAYFIEKLVGCRLNTRSKVILVRGNPWATAVT